MINTQAIADRLSYAVIDEWALEHEDMDDFNFKWFGKPEAEQYEEYQSVSAIIETIINAYLDSLGIEFGGYDD